MSRKALVAAGICLLVLPFSAARAALDTGIARHFGDLPLAFEENRGQANGAVRFLERGVGHALFLTSTEAVLVLGTSRHGGLLHLQLVGANRRPKLVGTDPLPGTTSYLVGRDPRGWRTGIPTYRRVRYRDVYPGIDLVYYGTHRELEHDFVVAPGADPRRIRLHLAGAAALRIDRDGDLLVALPNHGGEVRYKRPLIYQTAAGVRREIRGGYVRVGVREVAFRVDRYDTTAPLTIDPLVLFYATFATGGDGNEDAPSIAVHDEPDAQGQHHVFAYVAGQTTSMTFPTTASGFQSGLAGTANAFVLKLNESGTGLEYATYLGGTGTYGERANGIAVGPDGSAYVTGTTFSTDFPTTPGAYQDSSFGAPDAFITRLSPDGSDLLYSTYLGGAAAEAGTAIAVDTAGNVCVTGGTMSTPFTLSGGPHPFPLLHQLHDYPQFSGIFVAKFDVGGGLVYSSVIGGTDQAYRTAVAVDAQGACSVTGESGLIPNLSQNAADRFPFTANAFEGCIEPDDHCPGNAAFVLTLGSTGDLRYGSLLAPGAGGGGANRGTAIAAGTAGDLWIASDVYGGGAYHGLLTQIDPVSGKRLRTLPLAGSGQDHLNRIAVVDQKDTTGHSVGSLTFSGFTSSIDFPFIGPRVGGANSFVVQLDLTDLTPIYGSRFPVNGAPGIAVDAASSIYAAGVAAYDYPTTPGVFQQKPPSYPNIGRDKQNLVIFKLGQCPDADGDGLCDDWEVNGVSLDPGDGSGPQFIDLPKMGADPQRPDVFLHLDWMDCSVAGSDACQYCVAGDNDHQPCADAADCPMGACRAIPHSHALSRAAIKEVVDAFAASPYRSPTGSVGINLHVDEGPNSDLDFGAGTKWGALSKAHALAHADVFGATTQNNNYDWSAFEAVKKAEFVKTGRAPVFHFVIAGHGLPDADILGISRGIPASDLLISHGALVAFVGTEQDQADTLMHEFGHNLALHHGGGDDVNFKPNYLSIMNYLYSFDRLTKGGRRNVLDYSRSDVGTLDETRLDETVGLGAAAGLYGARNVCPGGSQKLVLHADGPIDWNCNAAIDGAIVSADVDGDGKCIEPGADGVLNTVPAGDDVVVGTEIWDGPNLTCESTRVGDDVQFHANGRRERGPLAGYDDWSHIEFVVGAIGRGAAALEAQPMESEYDPITPDLKLRLDPPVEPNCTTVADCDDGDTCTDDVCEPQEGCINAARSGCLPGTGASTTTTTIVAGTTTTTTLVAGGTTTTTTTTLPADPCGGLAGFGGVQCVCRGGVAPAACAVDRVPAAVGRLFQHGCALMQRAAALTTPKKVKKTVRGSDGAFQKALAKVTKAVGKHKLSPACGAALSGALGNVKQRTDRILGTL